MLYQIWYFCWYMMIYYMVIVGYIYIYIYMSYVIHIVMPHTDTGIYACRQHISSCGISGSLDFQRKFRFRRFRRFRFWQKSQRLLKGRSGTAPTTGWWFEEKLDICVIMCAYMYIYIWLYYYIIITWEIVRYCGIFSDLPNENGDVRGYATNKMIFGCVWIWNMMINHGIWAVFPSFSQEFSGIKTHLLLILYGMIVPTFSDSKACLYLTGDVP